MRTAKFLNDFVKQFSETLPPSLKSFQREFEAQFSQGLKIVFEKMDLVTREEFDIQTMLLERLQERVKQAEERLSILERASQKGE